MKEILNNWQIIIIACLTLGISPFLPEPHILGKIRWVLNGAVGMTQMDWFDLMLHGIPFVLLLRLFVVRPQVTKLNEDNE